MKSSTRGFSGLMQHWVFGVVSVLFISGCATTDTASGKVADPAVKKAASVKQQNQQAQRNSSSSGKAYYVMPHDLGKQNAAPVQIAAASRQTDLGKQEQDSAKTESAYQVGTASYYGKKFNGKKTASGERFDQNDLTCAHGSLPFGCRLRVTNLRNNKTVDVKVNDRGGFNKYGRVIDLSKAAAKKLGMLSSGTAKVQIEVLE